VRFWVINGNRDTARNTRPLPDFSETRVLPRRDESRDESQDDDEASSIESTCSVRDIRRTISVARAFPLSVSRAIPRR